ncbi:496_t:CDS:1, partial [Racocetra persica]
MYNLQRNNYHQNPKNSSIQTPTAVSEFLFDLLNNLFDKRDIILDIGSGR